MTMQFISRLFLAFVDQVFSTLLMCGRVFECSAISSCVGQSLLSLLIPAQVRTNLLLGGRDRYFTSIVRWCRWRSQCNNLSHQWHDSHLWSRSSAQNRLFTKHRSRICPAFERSYNQPPWKDFILWSYVNTLYGIIQQHHPIFKSKTLFISVWN